MNFNNLKKISVVDLTAICRSHFDLLRRDGQTRASVQSAIRNQPISVQAAIDVDIESAIQKGLVKYGKTRERVHVEDGQGASKRRRLQKEKIPVHEKGGFLIFFF